MSNRFYLTTHAGAVTPGTSSDWEHLAGDLVSQYSLILGDFATVTEVVCYTHSPQMAIHTFPFATAGTQPEPTHGMRLPSFCAQLCKWTTDGRTVKNHPIYLFNFIHGLYNFPGNPDAASQRSDILTFAERMADGGIGISDGTNDYRKCSPTGGAALEAVEEDYVTEHDLFA